MYRIHVFVKYCYEYYYCGLVFRSFSSFTKSASSRMNLIDHALFFGFFFLFFFCSLLSLRVDLLETVDIVTYLIT